MAYSIKTRERAINLRAKGYSLSEIHQKTGVSKSVISGWVKNVNLNYSARRRLLSKIKLGQFISAERNRQKTKEKMNGYRKQAAVDLAKININKITAKIICALIYWCEGGKNSFEGVKFTNSDPRLIKTFLYLLRKSFKIDEKKFRVCVHLHQYHNPAKQIKFWSRATGVPLARFIKPFLKSNTGKRIRENYPGCASVRYYHSDTARQLLATAEAFLSKYKGV